MSESSSFSPPSLVMATIGLSLATFMQVLDTTIANVALPTISGNLGVSSEQGTWVITSFAVSNAIALPLTGWLARRVGEVRLFIAAALLFVLASFLCGIAQSMPSLVGFRALQGFVAGPLYPITQTLLISIYPPAKRGMALALLAMVTVVAPIAGPILGGWITDDYSWPWIFFINVPVGLFAAFVVYQQLKARPVVIKKAPMDYVGLTALVIGVGALQIVLDKGNDLDWFESNFIVGGALIAAIALAFFIIWEFTDRHPIVNLRLFAHRNFAAGTLALVLGYAAFFGINLLLPQWLQTQMGYTATWAGLAAAPIGILPVFLAAGRPLRQPFRPAHARRPVVPGDGHHLLHARQLHHRGRLPAHRHRAVDHGARRGVLLHADPEHPALRPAPDQIADGSGLATFLRTLGGSFAASLTTWIWNRRATQHHAYLSENISLYDPATHETLAQLGGNTQANAALLDRMVQSQAYMMSTIDYFTMLGWLFLALLVIIWLARPPFGAKPGAAASGH